MDEEKRVAETTETAETRTAKAIEELSFREAMLELDGIISLLEDNSVELEQSLEEYARGVALLKSLKTRLDSAQQSVEVLMGELQEEALADELHDMTLS